MAQHSGFTLIEGLIVLVLLALLTGLAIPTFSSWLPHRQTEADRDHLGRLVQASRYAAATLNQPVILCPGGPGGCGRRNQWHLGALAFADANRNRRWDADEVRVAQTPGFASRIVFRSFRNRSYLRFNPTGLTDWQNGHFVICPPDGQVQHARQLVLNYAGRQYYSRDTDGDGVHEDVRGRPLAC